MSSASSPPAAPKPTMWLLTPTGELVASIVMGVALFTGVIIDWTASKHGILHDFGTGLSYLALTIGLLYGGRASWESLRERKFDIDVLMFVGAVLAAVIGAPSEGALLLFLFTLSGALEALAMQRTQRAVEALSKLMPTAALKLTGDQWVKVEPETLVVGDRVRILPGESIPADGKIVLGSSAINQATLTGESMPREVTIGDDIYAGTINAGNPVEAVVTKPASQSSLQKILNLVLQAQQQREPVQRVIDKVSQPYAIGVVVTSIAVLLIWWLALSVPLKDATYTAITLLIVASPCALIISTPTATLAAISRGARGGVLFKGGQSIERLARMNAVAFDKTGTLTIGRPRVMAIHAVGWSDEAHLLSVAAALEEHSTHPIAEAVVSIAQERSIAPAAAVDVTNVQGRGVSGVVDGKPVRLGSLKHTEELIPVWLRKKVADVLAGVQHSGHIAIVCAFDEMAAVFVLSDAVRPGADCLVRRLHEQGVRPVVMLTGDNEATAAAVAQSLGLDEFHAQLLPEDKVAQVERIKGLAGTVGVIGDGVNDAPALARADVAIGIGSIGSDAALESADIVLLSDDLSAVPWAVHLARAARRTVKINLCFALGAIGIMVAATLIGSRIGHPVPLWLGVIGHEGGTLLVVAHSLLLLAMRGVPLCACERPDAKPNAGRTTEPVLARV